MARKTPEVNAGSMADIAFLMLIFFLVTTTMDVDTGIMRQLSPPPLENQPPPDFKERNIMKILVNSSDRLLINNKIGDIRTLRAEVFDFMSIHVDDANYPEVTKKYIDNLGEVYTTKGLISIKNDRGTSYDMYIRVQNELARAFNEMKDEASMRYYGVKYTQLVDETKIDVINDLVPVRVSEAEPEDIGGGN
jgi:biopolymer transport protein ExbD